MRIVKESGKLNKSLRLLLISGLLILATANFGMAQGRGVVVIRPPKSPAPEAATPAAAECPETAQEFEKVKFDDLSEKSIQVNEEVAISVCISVGQIKINGWNRNEIRAFVDNGSKVGFSVLEKSRTNQKPVWVKILGYDPKDEENFRREECLKGRTIELDVPFGATVYIKSQESETTIDSVSKAVVKNIGGDIFLNKVKYGIDAQTYEGNVTVKNSGGSMKLETTTGNIVAYEAASNSIGDFFKAKTTSGAVTLQQITFRETEVNTSSGSINFIGQLLSGGQYYFSSQNGLIALTLAGDASAKIFSAYGFGQFESEIPLTNLKQYEENGLQSLSGILGGGDARINFKTVSGKIQIKKQ